MFLRSFVLSAFLTMTALPSLAHAWWEDGHVIVSKIAEENLRSAAQAGIKELLGENKEGEQQISDARICNWADYVPRSATLRRKYPKSDTWHYINIEIKMKPGDFKVSEDGNHVLGAIDRFKKVLKDPKAEKQDRKEALYFLVHFVGDMHQPLHCGNRDDDRGGNLQPVKSAFGKEEDKLNLHKVWDGHLVKAARNDLTVDDFAKRLLNDIKDEDRAKWSKGETKDWAWESHMIVVKSVYTLSSGEELPKEAIDLNDDNYMKANVPIVVEQLKKGGIRLSWVLNECFEEKK